VSKTRSFWLSLEARADWDAKRQHRANSRVHAKIEHKFSVLKRQWGFTKARYRGLSENVTQPFEALALTNVDRT